MKIVLVVEGVFPEKKGGLERWYKYLSMAFTKQGHNVTYINFSNVDGARDGVHYKSIQNNVADRHSKVLFCSYRIILYDLLFGG